jgi:RecA/RadA recombinase
MAELDLDKAFKDAQKAVEKEHGAPMLSISRMEELYGIPGCLPTGFPSLDLHLVQGNDGTYGWPYGAISELYGQQGALKSSRLYDAAVKNIRYGSKHIDEKNEGVSILFISEPDWDKEYIMSFGKRYGLSEEDLEKSKFKIAPVDTIEEMDTILSNFLEEYNEMANDVMKNDENPHQNLPRIFIGLDSMGKITAKEEKEENDDDFASENRRGLKAKAIHKFFKKHWMKFSKLGVCFLYSNHWRANMSRWGKDVKPAHDDALKYYPSVRAEVKKMTSGWSGKQDAKRDYNEGFTWRCTVYKVRDKVTFASKVDVDYYHNKGLDYFQSLIEAGRYAGILKLSNGLLKVTYYSNFILDDCDFHEEYEDLFPISPEDFREELQDNMSTLAADLETEIYERGAEEIVEEVVHREEG